MTDIFSIGVSGLSAAQRAISTTAHNISNVNTTDYSRQRAEFETRLPQFSGNGFFGNGVQLSAVNRIFNQTVINEIRANASATMQQKTYLDAAQRLDSLTADSDTGLNVSLQAFFSALHGVADNPSSIPARQVLLSQAALLANRFQTLDRYFTEQRNTLNNTLDSSAKEISSLAAGIAELNNSILSVTSSGNSPQPNDLLDQRDRLVNRLSELTQVSTIDQADGTLSVFIGTGQTLVVGSQANSLVAAPLANDSRNFGLYLRASGSTVQIDVTPQLQGGEIGGLLTFRQDILSFGSNQLGKIAIGVAESFNDQHALGMDLNNELGGLFFTDFNTGTLPASRVISPVGYAGPGNFAVNITGVNQMTASDYRLSLAGGTYTVTRLSDNQVINSFAAPGAVPATVTLGDGLELVISANASNGDSFLIAPTRDMASQFRRVIDDVNKIAAASPVAFESVLANTGSGIIKGVSVTNTSATTVPPSEILNGSLNPPYRIEFTSTTTFNVVNANTNVVVAAAVAFTPNQDNNLMALAGLNPGYEVTLAGAPRAGDTFNIRYNTGGIGDNRNMQELAGLQTTNIFNGGSATISGLYGSFIAEVGTRTNAAEINYNAANALWEQSKARREEISGVNLDEEAANLIKFQQAYEASAQVIAVANELFDTLFQSVR